MLKTRIFFTLIIILFSSTAWSNAIQELSKQTDVSRLEFVMLSLKQQLYEEFRSSDKILGFNRKLYFSEPAVDYEFVTFARNDELIIALSINDDLSCVQLDAGFDNHIMKNLVALKMDAIAVDLMMFFSHFGDYEDTDVFKDNMVHVRVAKLFGFEDFGFLDEDDLDKARAVSEKIKIRIVAAYCKKGERLRPFLLKFDYPLNANYEQFNADGQIFPAKTEW